MNNPLISIIIPVYKAEQHLDRCVESIVSQSYRNLEIILVDDGSPDKSGEVCDAWAARDARIKVVHKENGGISSARNAGLAIHTGEWIGFADDDDFVPEGAYESLMAETAGEKVGMVIGNWVIELEGEIEVSKKHLIKKKSIIKANEVFPKSFYKEFSPEIWNRVYSSILVQEIRFPKGMMAEDNYFNGMIAINMQVLGLVAVEIPDIVYYWRRWQNNSSKLYDVKMFLDLEKVQLLLALEYRNTFRNKENVQPILYKAWHEVLYTYNRFYVKDSIYYNQIEQKNAWVNYIQSLSWNDFLLLRPNRISHFLQFAIQRNCIILARPLQIFINMIHAFRRRIRQN